MSRDTRGNAAAQPAFAAEADGITQVVLVTHGWHMRRALRAFDEEASAWAWPCASCQRRWACRGRLRPICRWLQR
jgi:uncharacterized SAM-binding protein YcdF (DUF218 family)